MTTPVPIPRDVEAAVLPNGVRLITETVPHVRSVSVGIWLVSGSRCESPAENGLTHFIEHMLFKGTVNRSAAEIARLVDSIGGNLDAYTAKELVSFNTKVLDEHVPIAFDVLADLVLHPLFREEDIEKEKGVILEELKMENDSPEYLVHEIFSSNFWKGHPLGRPILGTKTRIRQFRRETVDSFYRRMYTAPSFIVTAAGNVTHACLAELAARYLGELPPGERVPESPRPQTHAGITLRNKRSLEQMHVCLGVPAYPLPHESRFVCYILNTILGGGMSSRLFQTIREKQGLAYSVFSELNPYRDTGCLAVYAGTSPATARQVIDSVLEQFRLLKQQPVPADELQRAKDHLRGSLLLGMESTTNRMANLARQEIYFQRQIPVEEMLERIARVTAEDVQLCARELLDPEQIALTMLGNLNGLQVRREDLEC